MPIIDLETGELTEQQPAQPAPPLPIQEEALQPQPAQTGGIIDLNTGEFASEQPSQQPAEAQLPEGTLLDTIVEPLQAVIGGATGQVVAGLGGIGASVFDSPESGAKFVKDIEQSVQQVVKPETKAGQEALQTLGDLIKKGVDIVNFPISGLGGLLEVISGQGLDQAANTVNSIQSKGLGKTAGSRVFEETGNPLLATMAEIAPDVALESAGFKGISKAQRAKPQNISRTSQSQAERVSARAGQEASQATGIDLFKAQQTLNPTDIERQSFVATLPEGAVAARDSLARQNEQALTAVNSILDDLAPAQSIGNAPAKFRTAAQSALEKQKLIRREKSSPIYNQAFREAGEVDVSSVNDLIDSKLVDLPEGGQISKTLKKAKGLISGKKSQAGDIDIVEPPSLKKLHNAKIEIDQMLEKFGDGSLGNATKRNLVEVQQQLLREIENASPAYKQARETFARESGPVNKISDSIVGKIAGLDDAKLKSVSKSIFDPSETNPKIIDDAKKLINDSDPSAWNEIVRTELERRMGRIRADIGDSTSIAALENVPSQLFNSIFGNKKSRDILYRAADADTRKNLKYLETSLRRATKGRPGGSQTAVRSEISRELKGGIFQSLREFFKAPVSTVASVGEDAIFNNKVRALSESMFDPTWKDDMRRIRELPPASSKAKKLMDKLLNSALITAPAITTEDDIKLNFTISGGNKQEQK